MEMRRLVTGKQMKEIDGYAIRKVGIPSLVLMERAALAVADEMEKRYGKLSGQRLLVFCGTGNNGAAARRWLGFSFCAARFRRFSRSVTRRTGRGDDLPGGD